MISVKDFFFSLSTELFTSVRATEWCELYLSSENTDFVRLNQGKVRQPGHVEQHYLTVRLGRDQRKISNTSTLTTQFDQDVKRLNQVLSELRSEIEQIPNDPYLVKIENAETQEKETRQDPPSNEKVLDSLFERSRNLDLVGLYTRGDIYRGFASSFGQRSWFSTRNFQLDWSIFHKEDNALKSSYSGETWSDKEFSDKWDLDLEQFKILQKPRKKLSPGNYRIYLSPSAMEEITTLLSWGAFSSQAIQNKSSPFLRLYSGEERFSSLVSMNENIGLGLSPMFNAHGDVKPEKVLLIDQGSYKNSLISSRSARQYGFKSNAAEDQEQPLALDIQGGQLPNSKILESLHNGIYVNNLWYMNYSDRMSCKTTGMTRFATFWVENGKIQYPIEVLRFDESLYRAFGTKLEALTQQRELVLSNNTYGERSTRCFMLPGALIDQFAFCQ